jgi:hypothetical protein
MAPHEPGDKLGSPVEAPAIFWPVRPSVAGSVLERGDGDAVDCLEAVVVGAGAGLAGWGEGAEEGHDADDPGRERQFDADEAA